MIYQILTSSIDRDGNPYLRTDECNAANSLDEAIKNGLPYYRAIICQQPSSAQRDKLVGVISFDPTTNLFDQVMEHTELDSRLDELKRSEDESLR